MLKLWYCRQQDNTGGPTWDHRPAEVRKNDLSSLVRCAIDHFTKIGSGQTYENSLKNDVSAGMHDVSHANKFGIVVYDWSNAKAIWVRKTAPCAFHQLPLMRIA